MARIACLLVPLFPLAARLRSSPELEHKAVAVVNGNGAAARVVAAAKNARQAGIRPGMTLAQARSVLPDLVARGRDPAAEHSAHEALLELAFSLSPRVEDCAEHLVYAEVSGMERLFPGADGERHLGCSVLASAETLRLPLRIGIAANKLAARVAAERSDSPTVVPAGQEAEFLAPLSLDHLHLASRLRETLGSWGITTAGELALLPADEVATRLGIAGIRALQAAQGVDAHPLVPLPPPPTLCEGSELEWAVVMVEPLLFALRQSLERVQARLEQQDLVCRLIELELRLEPEGIACRRIRLPAPTRDVDALLSLIRLELETTPPPAPVVGFRCTVFPHQARCGQLTLFGPAELAPERLAATLAQLVARLGAERVGSPQLIDGHLPERSACQAFAPPPPPKLRRPPRRGRGLLAVRVLRPPVALEVITAEVTTAPAASPPCLVNDVPPTATPPPDTSRLRLLSVASAVGATPRIQGRVQVSAGPWHLETDWWSDAPVERDYWDVELTGGGLYRLFRDRSTNDWFADGVYD